MREEEILYEECDFWISFEESRNCYVIWEVGVPHSIAVGFVGKSLGLEYAIKRLKNYIYGITPRV